jgi:hypothetical protein
MLSLIQFNLPVIAAALLIGVATARWIFRRRPRRTEKGDDS